MNDFKTFLQTDKGRYLLIGVMVIIAALIMYFIFFKSEDKPLENGNQNAETNVTVRDTSFTKRGDVYTTYEDKRNKVDPDADFFKSGTDEMRDAINSAPSENREAELQRKADSILRANQSKVNYANSKPTPPRYSSSGGYASTVTKVDKDKLRKEEIENFQKESRNSFNEFFQGTNGDKKGNLQNNSSILNKKSLPSDDLIYAVISGDQLIKNRDRVSLKLTRDAVINGSIYRKNTFIYAIASFTQNRVNLNITNINQNPVSLVAQDAQDGNIGIYIEGESLVAETAGEAVEDGVRDFDVKGIPVGKTIKRVFTRKQREQKVQLLNNYKIILKSNEY